MEIEDVEIAPGKFVLMGGCTLDDGGQGLSNCGQFDSLEQARRVRACYIEDAPLNALIVAQVEGEQLSDSHLEPGKALEYLGMKFIIYDDQKNIVE